MLIGANKRLICINKGGIRWCLTQRYKSTSEEPISATSVRTKSKSKKPIDLTLALKHTARLKVHQNELKSLDNEDDPLEVPTKYKKLNKSYIHEINNSIMTPEMRWAIQKSNRDKILTESSSDGAKEKLGSTKSSSGTQRPNSLTYFKSSAKSSSNYKPPSSSSDTSGSKLGSLRVRPTKLAPSAKTMERIEASFGSIKRPSTGSSSKSKLTAPYRYSESSSTARKVSGSKHAKAPILSSKVRLASKIDRSLVGNNRKAHARKSIVSLQQERMLDHNSLKIEQGTLTVNNEKLVQAKPLDKEKIPKLAHRLDRTLFSPGVHFLQDPRTRVYNFPPFLKNVIKYEDFDFDAIAGFTNVSKDKTLLEAAIANNKQFYSSTSSMTVSLIQFYFLLNNYHPDKIRRFEFPAISGMLSTLPASLIVRPRGTNPKSGKTIYSVESDHSYDQEILLSAMGHCLETFLTTEEKEFEKFDLKNQSSDSPQIPENVYNYSTFGDFLMRSQLDCYDERLPGNGTFDLKTRAVCSIRYDSSNPDLQENKYQIWKLKGGYESFGREFDDLIKTGALLKYLFQARIGQMDGIFIAYHNINSLFGFQYLPLEELDNIFYNHKNNEIFRHTIVKDEEESVDLSTINDGVPTFVGETQFKQSLKIWENIMKLVIKNMSKPDESFRLFLKTKRFHNETKSRLYVFAVPVSEEQIRELQGLPSKFETSFKDDLTQEDRLLNLQAHRRELTKLNESMVKGALAKKIQAYYVDINQQIIDNREYNQGLSPYPHKVDSDWDLRYKVHKMNNNTKEQVDTIRSLLMDLLAVPMQAITGSHEKSVQRLQSGSPDILESYSKIGKARAEEWLQKDNNPIIYEPKSIKAN